MNFNLQPLLENDLVVLRPLKEEDFENLFKVASDSLIWEQHQNKDRHTKENFTKFFNEAIKSKSAYAIFDKDTLVLIGSSRFRVIDELESVIEIGWSFLARDYWGGKYNLAFKKLMVNHALQSFKYVIFYVHSKNIRSQRALTKLGALKIDDSSKSWVLPKGNGVTLVIDKALI